MDTRDNMSLYMLTRLHTVVWLVWLHMCMLDVVPFVLPCALHVQSYVDSFAYEDVSCVRSGALFGSILFGNEVNNNYLKQIKTHEIE